jgi:hypothetical protein
MSTRVHPRRIMLVRFAVVVLALMPMLLAAPGLVRRHQLVAAVPPPVETTPRVPFTDEGPVLGYAMVCHHISDMPLYLESVDRIHELGANALVVVTPFFQERVDSSSIRRVANRCPRRTELVAILNRARALGMRTTLQPIVLIEDPGENDWRGVLQPERWDRWWTSYEQFIDYFLDIAIEAGVDLFAMGSELNSTEEDVDRWKRIAARIRLRFDGQITYSANWDRFEKVNFWPLVDVISVSSYFELQRDRPDAPVADLVADWSGHRDELTQFAADWERPLLLSEVGYPSLSWATAHPWNYVADGATADHEAQARGYRAFFEAWREPVAEPANPVLGFHCYHWDPYNRGGRHDTGYGIQGKPAANVVRAGFAEINARFDEILSTPLRPTSRPTDKD